MAEAAGSVTSQDPTPGRERGLLARIFVSPDEPRLRAGWRLVVHSVILVSLVGAASLAVAVPLAVFGFTDLDRLSELILPLTSLAMLPAVTLATWSARRFLDRRSFASLGLKLGRRTWRDLLVGALIPAPLFAAVYAVFSALGWLEFDGWSWSQAQIPSALLSLFAIGLVFVAVGFYEELLFRGYYLQNLIDGTNLPLAVLISSALFSLAHLGNFSASWASTLGILLAGLFLTFAWVRGGSLWLPIGIHIGWNFFQGPVFGFAVSGTPTPTLIQHTVSGPTLITGGAFGPEAGLTVVPAMAVGSALIWLYTRARNHKTSSAP